MFATGALVELATALLSGKENVIEDLLVRKFQGMGEKLLMDTMGKFVTSPLFREIPVVQQYEQTRRQWLNAVQPGQLPGQRILNTIQSLFEGNLKQIGQPGQHGGAAWEHTDWATSRQDWLDNRWRHDWRSQPRDVHGRWIPGRLEFIAQPLMYRGKRAGRIVKKQRRIRRRRRKFIRGQIKNLIKLTPSGT